MFHCNRKLFVFAAACGIAAVLWSLSAGAGFAQCVSCGPSYMAPVAAAPVYSAYYPAPYYPVPAVTYRAYYQPTVVAAYRPVVTTAYQPVVPYSVGVGYSAVTTYRPFFRTWTTRLVPYTTYSPIYSSAVAYSPCAGGCMTLCNPCAGCNPCGGDCGSAISYGAPVSSPSSCSSCVQPTLDSSVPNGVQSAAPTPAQRKTFGNEVQKPAEQPIDPIPTDDTRIKSMNTSPAPLLHDPRDRTTARPIYSASRIALTSLPVPTAPVQDDGGWRASSP